MKRSEVAKLIILILFVVMLAVLGYSMGLMEMRVDASKLGRIVDTPEELTRATAEYLMSADKRAYDLLALAMAILASVFGVFMGLRELR